MSWEPVVDVVLATNRRSRFLAETLDSVTHQTWPHWWVTLVDDGGPDPESLRQAVAGRERLTVVRQSPGGLSAARNTGIAATTGDLLAFLDDDDVWRPDKLEKQVALLGERPDAAAAYSGGWYLDERGSVMGEGWRGTPGNRTQMRSLQVPLPRITTLLCRRSAVQRAGGFDTSLEAAEDLAFAMALLAQGSCVGVDEALTGYRRHASNMTRTIPAARLNELADLAFRKVIADARSDGDVEAVAALKMGQRRARDTAASQSLRRARHGVAAGQYKASIEDLWWSLTRAPRAVARVTVSRLGGDQKGRMSADASSDPS